MGYDNRYDPDADFDRWYTLGTARAITPWLRRGDEVLELGCATGLMTAAFVEEGASVLGVDRSETYLERAAARGLPNASFVSQDVTRVDLDRVFDHVILANLVHEMTDPGALFAVVQRHLRPGGLAHVTVPNPRSIHRLVGMEMGLLADLTAVGERATGLETLRMVDADQVERLGAAVGLRAVHRSGVMLKPLPNELMEGLSPELLEGLLGAARHLPEVCAMSYVVLR